MKAAGRSGQQGGEGHGHGLGGHTDQHGEEEEQSNIIKKLRDSFVHTLIFKSLDQPYKSRLTFLFLCHSAHKL